MSGLAEHRDLQSLIETAIRRIIPIERRSVVEPLLPAAIHALCVEGGDGKRAEKSVGARTTARELKNVSDAARKLQEAINDMHSAAASRFKNLAALSRSLNILRAAADAPGEAFEGSEQADRKTSGLRPSEQLALTAAIIFTQLTGKSPGITNVQPKTAGTAHKYLSGAYPEFLSEIFAARGMKPSGMETAAKKALATLKSQNNGNKDVKTDAIIP
jgi:hypothetical protein